MFNDLLLAQAADAAKSTAEAVTKAAEASTDKAGELATELAAPVTDAAASGSGMNATLIGLMILGIVVLPFVLGAFFARILKLREMGSRMGLCLFALVLGSAPFLWHAANGRDLATTIRRGIDLAGGTNLVYQAEIPEDKLENASAVMNQMVGAVGRRINPTGVEEVTVRQVGADRIEVIMPGADPAKVSEMKKRMTKLGSLEFGIMASTRFEPDIVQRGRAMPTDVKELRDTTGMVIAQWKEVGEKITPTGPVLKDVTGGRYDVVRMVEKETRDKDGNLQKREVPEFLLLADPVKQRVTGKYLKRASPDFDEKGQLICRFRFDAAGGTLFQRLTSRFQPSQDGTRRRLCVLLDDRIHSAPTINDVISTEGTISGDFDRKEIDELVGVLNAGALVVPLKPEPISEATVDPTLGADVQNKGKMAIIIAGLGVVVFMLVYYRFAGLVAVLCLIMNLVLVMGTMVLINATFTLPGLAGMVLTIGMAVDANVLIFERIREENSRGASLRMAIQNGFDKAFTTIVDANVTTLITAVILYMIGTDTVKGFAVTLFIGIVMSMFTALYFGRLLFDICERKGLIKKVSMMSIVGKTEWDFIGKRGIATVVSVCVIAVGLLAFFSRGASNYDIDFTGGTMVTFQFDEDHETEDVKAKLAETFQEAITLERLTLAGEETSRHFRLRTTERDADNASNESQVSVQRMVNDTFADDPNYNLRKVNMSFGELVKSPAPESSEEDAKFDPFAGGYNVSLNYTDEVNEATIIDTIAQALASTPGNYERAENLFKLEGTSGAGTTAEAGTVRKFDAVDLQFVSAVSEADLSTALSSVKENMATSPLFDEVNSFASTVAGEMKQSAISAILVSLFCIVCYIWARFQRISFGFAAVAALVHDVLVVLGAVALASYLSGNALGAGLLLNDFRINLPMVAAFLTIVGYSLNDTIVVFDRIREVRGKNPSLTPEIVNISLNQTLSRTLLTSLTTFIVVLILYAIGGEGIHGFAFCLVMGVIVGTYSSIYVASPVLLWLMNRGEKTAASMAPPAKAAATAAGK